MRLVSYGPESSRRCGIQVGDTVYDASAVAQAAGLALDYQSTDWSKTEEVIASDDRALRLLETIAKGIQESRINDGMALALNNVRLGPPIPDPEKIICLGLNYRDYAKEANLPLPQAPMLFAKFRNSLIGPFDDIELPYANEKVDYEAELAVVIGRRAKYDFRCYGHERRECQRCSVGNESVDGGKGNRYLRALRPCTCFPR